MLQITSPAIEEILKRALAFHRAGDFAQADKLYVQILTTNPQHAETLRWRGYLAAQVGQPAIGIELLKKAIELRPDYADAWNDLGNVYLNRNQHAEAIDAFQRAVKISPRFVEGISNLGIVLARVGEREQAMAAFRQAIALRPDFCDPYNGLGMTLKDVGRIEEGIEVLRKLLRIKPDHPEGLNNLGNAYKACQKYDEAIAEYRKAIAARPGFPEAYNNMANAYKDSGRLDESIAIYREAIAIAPTWAEIHNNLANALKDAGRMHEALDVYREALRLRPSLVPAHSNLVYVRQFLPEVNPAEDLRDARAWDELHGQPHTKNAAPHENDRSPERRLRIGYVSPDFRTHSVAYYIEPLLECHDPNHVETFCYSDVAREDATTQRLRGKAHNWRSILSLHDARVAEMIRADHIDILVDLTGHTAANRLGAFARKPAPVQASYLGYSGTTGVAAIDYRLTDVFADPSIEGNRRDSFYSEELVRLPETFICFRADEESPAVAESPVVANGFVTFGSFNAMPKMTNAVVALWSRILWKCAGSRLVLKTRGLSDAGQRKRLISLFASHGITEDRIELAEKVETQLEHLDFYRRLDIALDTFPYNGTTTTCEAMWMGVPVVTLAGNVHRSRVGVSILRNVGLPELIAQSEEEYVRIAANLAADTSRLRELRSGLRERMRTSPLMSGPRFTKYVEAAYRDMWRRWCASATA